MFIQKYLYRIAKSKISTIMYIYNTDSVIFYFHQLGCIWNERSFTKRMAQFDSENGIRSSLISDYV